MKLSANRRVFLLSAYRVQLTDSFGFGELRKTIPYLKKLGIRTLYLSPVLEAAPGSTHFYDVTDPEKISESLGGEKEFEEMLAEARKEGLSIMVDVVANHMALQNALLDDILSRGNKSEFYNFFDIDWYHPRAFGKLMLPVLERYASEMIRSNDIRFSGDRLFVDGFSLPFMADGIAVSRDEDIVSHLERQNYILTRGSSSGSMINYRRFFAVNSLIAMNMDSDHVFSYYHRKLFEYVDRGLIDAFRIDHVDGLHDPERYFLRLKEKYENLGILAEKILTAGENIPDSWNIDGTTGYESLREINGLFVDSNSLDEFRDIFREYAGSMYESPFYTEELKIETIERKFGGDIRNLARHIVSVKSSDISWYGVPQERVEYALKLVIAFFGRYRTYVSDSGGDIEPLVEAVDRAEKYQQQYRYEFSLLRSLILEAHENEDSRSALMKIQTFTGAVMAKAVEDCLLYRYVPLLSLNEVGISPYEDHIDRNSFFRHFEKISKSGLQTLNPLSTHDTKMGEDLRARYNALMDFRDLWEEFLESLPRNVWISKKDSYFIAQVMAAHGEYHDSEDRERVHSFIQKSLREGSEYTSWENPDQEYERECIAFADGISLSGSMEFKRLSSTLAEYGSLNTLSQTVLKIMLPGTADIYQGSEIYNTNFADPDNRRNVDFESLATMLENLDEIETPDGLSGLSKDEVKLWLTSRLLSVRSKYSEFIEKGKFVEVEWKGPGSEYISSFGYILRGDMLLTAATKHHRYFKSNNDFWKENRPHISRPEFKDGVYRDLLNGREFLRENIAESIFGNLPAGVVLISDIHGMRYEK